MKICMTQKSILEQLDILKGVLHMGYPGYNGLGEWEPARFLIEQKYESQTGFYIELPDFLKY